MKEGFWINYENGKVFEIDEHEQWLRRGVNAKTLGVPPLIRKGFKNFESIDDRDGFLLYVMSNAPVMRFRGHGASWTFEFNSTSISKPLESIYFFCEDRAGPYTNLVINNFGKNNTVDILWKEFKEAYDNGNSILIESKFNKHSTPFKILSRFDKCLNEMVKKLVN